MPQARVLCIAASGGRPSKPSAGTDSLRIASIVPKAAVRFDSSRAVSAGPDGSERRKPGTGGDESVQFQTLPRRGDRSFGIVASVSSRARVMSAYGLRRLARTELRQQAHRSCGSYVRSNAVAVCDIAILSKKRRLLDTDCPVSVVLHGPLFLLTSKSIV